MMGGLAGVIQVTYANNGNNYNVFTINSMALLTPADKANFLNVVAPAAVEIYISYF